MVKKRLRYCERGTSLVEFALILPLFLLLLLGMVDLGQGFNTYLALLNATREGAIWLAKNADDLTGMNTRIAGELQQVGLTTNDVMVLRVPEKTLYTSGDLVTVKVEYNYPAMFSAMTGIPSLTLQTAHTVRVQ